MKPSAALDRVGFRVEVVQGCDRLALPALPIEAHIEETFGTWYIPGGGGAHVYVGSIELVLENLGLNRRPAHLAIRPQSLCLSSGPADGALAGTGRKATYLDSRLEYSVRPRQRILKEFWLRRLTPANRR